MDSNSIVCFSSSPYMIHFHLYSCSSLTRCILWAYQSILHIATSFTCLKPSSCLIIPIHLKYPCLQNCLTFQNLLHLLSTLFLPIYIYILFVSEKLDSLFPIHHALSLLCPSLIISVYLEHFYQIYLSPIHSLRSCLMLLSEILQVIFCFLNDQILLHLLLNLTPFTHLYSNFWKYHWGKVCVWLITQYKCLHSIPKIWICKTGKLDKSNDFQFGE